MVLELRLDKIFLKQRKSYLIYLPIDKSIEWEQKTQKGTTFA